MRPTIGKTHHSQQANKLEALWDDLLSRQPERVQAAYTSLETSERQAVYSHLRHMARDPGWQPEQRASARAALQALENQSG
jgi:hypothetical protein